MKTYEKSALSYAIALIGLSITLAILLLTSCEKQEPSHNGTYTGTITYYLTGYQQQTTSSRQITDNGDGTTKIHWWDAPDVNCYTVISDGSYPINNVEIISEPYCNGVKQKNKLLFIGIGKFIGDSLIESGIVYHFTNIGSTFENSESGTWHATFKKN